MQADLFLACLLICLGAMLAYIADERYSFTPRIAEWLGRVIDQG